MAYSPYWIYRSKWFDVSFSFGKGSTMYEILVAAKVVFSCEDYSMAYTVYGEWKRHASNPSSTAFNKEISMWGYYDPGYCSMLSRFKPEIDSYQVIQSILEDTCNLIASFQS